jgi:methylenetetrahydrofolate reductase (NADPH)
MSGRMHGDQLASSPPSGDRQRRIARLLSKASVETTARPVAVHEACVAPLPPGSDIYITWLRGDAAADRVAAAARLRQAGFNPVPHIAARYVANARQLRDILARLVGEASVEKILLVGGDADRTEGEFGSSLELLERSGIEQCDMRAIGVGAYPEGHPRIPIDVMEWAMSAKLARLRAMGVSPYVVTQFCFEAAPILDWLDRFRQKFDHVPVHVGLAGPAKLTTLLKYGASCGLGNSMRALRRQPAFTRVFSHPGPDTIISDIACHALQAEVARLHFFTFGGIGRTAAWIRASQRGQLPITDSVPAEFASSIFS